VEAVGQVGDDVVVGAKNAVRGAIQWAADVGGDVAAVAVGAVEGAVAAAAKIGGDVTKVARGAAEQRWRPSLRFQRARSEQ
jgi:hypothetical protein